MLVRKRDGREVEYEEYDGNKVIMAIKLAMSETKNESFELIEDIEEDIMNYVSDLESDGIVASVEDISNEVEKLLMMYGMFDVSKSYILYRASKNKARKNEIQYKYLSKEFLSKYKHAESPFPNQLGEFVYYRTYSRYIEKLGRREYWWETVARAVDYNMNLIINKNKDEAVREAELLYDNIFNLRQFLSGRTLYSGGSESSKAYGMSNYNCSFTIIDDFKAYKDMFYLLMIGAGVGFRVLKKDVARLPKIRSNINIIHSSYKEKKKYQRQEHTSLIFTGNVAEIVIGDSKEAWTDALYKLLELHSEKQYRKIDNIIINYDNIRPKGERLKTFGGYSSGHQSMLTMLTKISKILNNKI
jgi:ribonucleotide reductase alpha subunit